MAHSPQRKVLEFLVAILAGLEHLQEICRSAHPIDQHQIVAKSWGQSGWADYSGVSRTIAGMTQTEAEQITGVLERISRPILTEEVMQALQSSGRLTYDGSLTARPVSNTSTTYPGVAYGHMGDGLQLGYQAAMVSSHSPIYGRSWLSVASHPGDTVSCTQAEALIRAAEAKTGLRPLRWTALLRERIRTREAECQTCQTKAQESQEALEQAQARLTETRQQHAEHGAAVLELEAQYHRSRQHPERPYSTFAKAHQQLSMLERRRGMKSTPNPTVTGSSHAKRSA